MAHYPGENRRFYVYELVDPRDGAVFYVGKGQGKRDRAHIGYARRMCVRNPAKTRRIREIMDAGHEVGIVRVVEGLGEVEALRLERAEIASHGLANLTNISRGQHTEPDRLLLQIEHEMQACANHIAAIFTGQPCDRATWHRLFDHIRALRRIREVVEAEAAV
jgi:hypothetical protein